MKKFTTSQARELAKKYNIDFDIVPLDEFRIGLDIEREHLPYLVHKLPKRDLVDAIVNITLAHLEEDSRYYKFLDKQEKTREAYWEKRGGPPDIYL